MLLNLVSRFSAPALLLIAAGGTRVGETGQALRWQADIQIRTLEVTRSRTEMSIRVVVYSENDDDARDAHVLILIPVAMGIERLAPECSAVAAPSLLPSLRATVSCDLGAITNRGYREVRLATTLPPDRSPRRIGVFAYSATADPVPGNNYAERIIP